MSKDIVLDLMRAMGRSDALTLRANAAGMDGTSIIAQEVKVPSFDPEKDYSGWPVGAPVQDDGQVYTLIQPHNAAHYPDTRPSASPALWSITHTKDPARAKPYLPPNGTSGLYMEDEVATVDGAVWCSTVDNNPYPPGTVGYWEAVE